MDSHRRQLAAVFVSTLAFALMGAGHGAAGRASADYNALPSYVPALPASPGSASIFSPSSGDFAGFRIIVAPGGQAIAVDGAGSAQRLLEPGIVAKFFADLAAAGPLGALPASSCAVAPANDSTPTVEVITPLTIGWRGQKTRPLSCVGDAREVKLILDATTIQRALYVQAYRKRSTLAYGEFGYANAGGYGAGGYGAGGAGFYFAPFGGERFSGEQFSNSRFDGGRFTMDRFDGGFHPATSPWVGANYANPSFASLPYASFPSSSIPSTGLQGVNPYTASPFSGGPTGASPFSYGFSSGLPSASGPTTVSHP